MKCPKCGIGMTRQGRGIWACRNPRCVLYGAEQAEPEKNNQAEQAGKAGENHGAE